MYNASLGVDWLGNYAVSFYQPSYNFRPLAGESFAAFNTANIVSQAHNQYLTYSSYNTQWAWQTAGYLNIGNGIPSFHDVFASGVYHSESRASLGWLGDGLAQEWSAVHDPVHAVTGEFYVDTADLSLVGPLPLEIRRNYSSLNLANNQFGIGWKLAFTLSASPPITPSCTPPNPTAATCLRLMAGASPGV